MSGKRPPVPSTASPSDPAPHAARDPRAQRWDPAGGKGGGPAKPGFDPSQFRSLSPAQQVETLLGLFGVIKQFGGDPAAMLRDVIRDLSPEQKARIAADPALKAQLGALLKAL